MPKCSPLIVTLVPGGPSFGEIPVTTGLLAIDKKKQQIVYKINDSTIWTSRTENKKSK